MTDKTRKIRCEKGVTLIELMISLSIIGILSTVAYPSYTQYILSSHRTTAQSTLIEVLAEQQNYYARNMAFTDDLSELGYTTTADGDGPDAGNSLEIGDGRYRITAAACSAPLSTLLTTCVQLTATAAGAQTSDGNLTANSAGGKTPASKW